METTMNKIDKIFITPKYLRQIRILELIRLTKIETKYLIKLKKDQRQILTKKPK
jgi:hypothetical protein